jgi:DNA invertase Pin-like site-specific DNA recombinase
MPVRIYQHANMKKPHVSRAESELKRFARERNSKIAAIYVETESGTSFKRPELFRLLTECQAGDILLVEQIDHLTRLTISDWDKLLTEIKARDVLIVSVDLPTSWVMLSAERSENQERIYHAINSMMLDVLAAIDRKDYEERRRRQQQGIANAKAAGGYRGRPENTKRNDAIMAMLRQGQTWENIRSATKCSNSTIARLAKRIKMSEAAQ